MSRFPGQKGASFNTSENGGNSPTSDTDAGRFEVLLHEALLNPVHHLVVEDLLYKTLQDLVLGENQDEHLGVAKRLLASPPSPAAATAAATQPPQVTPACFLTEGARGTSQRCVLKGQCWPTSPPSASSTTPAVIIIRYRHAGSWLTLSFTNHVTLKGHDLVGF